MKSKLFVLITGCLVWLMSSCLGDDNYSYEYELARNCQIASFTLANDSITELSNVKFTIDQLSGLIFNIDSLPYGTVMGKAVCTIQYANSSAVSSIQVMQEAVGDTIEWNASDSLDFSQPVRFVVWAYDGTVSKTYETKINIHQLVPDTMEWSLYATNLTAQTMKEQRVVHHTYQGQECYFLYGEPAGTDLPYRLYYAPANNLAKWTEIPLEGLPPGQIYIPQLREYEGVLYVPSAIGTLYQSTDGQQWKAVRNTPHVSYLIGGINEEEYQGSVLATIVEENGTLHFSAMDENQQWAVGDEVPAGFPLTGFGYENFYSMYHEYLMIVGGRTADNQLVNSAWATLDGKSWALLTDENAHYFERMEGPMVKAYDDKIYLIGGIDAAGKAYKDIYETIDKGVSWARVDSMIILPEVYRERGFGTLIVGDDQYLNIIGGKMSSRGNVMQEIWRGRINRLVYDLK
ncbi:DUF6242 domain-containing protein [Parabacteroides sp. PF5-6]|uniref:DUF6242 domain-containing protein n=1 Tax=Parabacteroides sp. PF5-6 TaxID=1742403 RepID=UPI002406F887|nr:DUF6242 domain-containing protein [Parabacteroides sp. PF5-6]MDF9829354.1 hypothetical protein [Parabacteroides sp. PF5-6]